jgi:hypothetical protein
VTEAFSRGLLSDLVGGGENQDDLKPHSLIPNRSNEDVVLRRIQEVLQQSMHAKYNIIN